MKKLREYLIVLVILGVSQVSYASINVSTEKEIIASKFNTQENSVVVASNAGIQLSLEGQPIISKTDTAHINTEPMTISVVGIVFALFLVGAGKLVRRKTKVKANDIVGTFARTN